MPRHVDLAMQTAEVGGHAKIAFAFLETRGLSFL